MTTAEMELARWQGETEQRLDEHDRRLNAINGSIEKGAQAMVNLTTEVVKIGTRVAVWAAVAAFGAGILGAVVAAVIVFKLTGHAATTTTAP